MALTIDSATTVEDFKVLFHRAEDKSDKLETEVKRLRHDTDVAVTTLKHEVVKLQAEAAAAAAASTQQRQMDRIDLIDNKMISPTLFDGGKVEAFKPWVKRLKAFCNAKCAGFRLALDAAEKSEIEVDDTAVARLGWEPAANANKKLYDLLGLICSGEALVIVERHPEQGFEAFRQLSKRFHPIGETYAFDKINTLMHPIRCKSMSELPSTIEKWEASMRQYEDRSGESFPESMKMPILMQMIPTRDLDRVLYRFRMTPGTDYSNFSKQLVEFGIERRYEAMRGSGATPMDLDEVDGGRKSAPTEPSYAPLEEYTAEQWREWHAQGMPEDEPSADWLSKGGKGKGGKGGGKTWQNWPPGGKTGGKAGGKGGKGSGCGWCGKDDHWKKDCKEFQKWKDDRDAERAKNGQPPYVPPSRSRQSAPLKSLDIEQEPEFLPVGGMTADCDVLGDEDDIGSAEIDLGFVPYRGPDSVNVEVERSHEYAEFLDEEDTRLYWEIQQALVVDTIISPPEAVFARPTRSRKFNRNPICCPGDGACDRHIDEGGDGEVPEVDQLGGSHQDSPPASARGTPPPPWRHSRESPTAPSITGSTPLSEIFRSYSEQSPTDRSAPSPAESSDAAVIQREALSFYNLSMPWMPLHEESEPLSEGSIIEIPLVALGSTMDLVPRSDDGSQRQDQDQEAPEQVAMPKPSTGGKKKKTSGVMVKHKGTQTVAPVTTADASTQVECVLTRLEYHACQDVATKIQGSTVAVHSTVTGFGSRRRRSQTTTSSPWEGGPREARDVAKTTTLLSLVDSPRTARAAAEETIVVFDRRNEVTCACVGILVMLVVQVAHVLVHHDGWICTEAPLDAAGVAKGKPIPAAKFSKIGSLKNIPEKLMMRRGITMDSGAHSNVMPKRMINVNRIRPSPGSIRGVCFVAADNGRIPNEGEVDLQFDTLEGEGQEWIFQIAEANKPLGSVADRVDHRCRVVFDKDDDTDEDVSYIYDKAARKMTKMRRDGNVWKVDAIVVPSMIMSDQEMDFSRQG